MNSFRANKTDVENIEKIVLLHGGISKSAAIRIALHEVATKEPKLVIRPRIAPIREFEKTISNLGQFINELADANRCGWPEHYPSESTERTLKVEAARRRNDAAYAEFLPRLDELRILIKSVKGCEALDVTRLKAETSLLQTIYVHNIKLSEDPNVSSKMRDSYARTTVCLRTILGFLSVVGLINIKCGVDSLGESK